MMPHALKTNSLNLLKSWARQHCRNAVQDAILFYSPDHFSWEDCYHVEERTLAYFEPMIAHLTVDRLRNLRYMNGLMTGVVGETVRLLKRARRQQR